MSNVVASPRRCTLDEWAARASDERGELIDGTLEEEELAGVVHELIVSWLCEVLRRWARARGAMVLGSNVDLAVSDARGRHPDLAVYFAGRRPAATGLVTLPPDLVVEVVSASPRDARRDRVTKRGEYAAFGVRNYWIVDPGLRTFEFLELGADGRYIIAASAESGLAAPIPGCEGLTLDLDELWAEADAAVEP